MSRGNAQTARFRLLERSKGCALPNHCTSNAVESVPKRVLYYRVPGDRKQASQLAVGSLAAPLTMELISLRCPHCGHETVVSVSYCPACGEKMPAPPPGEQAAEPSAPDDSPAEEPTPEPEPQPESPAEPETAAPPAQPSVVTMPPSVSEAAGPAAVPPAEPPPPAAAPAEGTPSAPPPTPQPAPPPVAAPPAPAPAAPKKGTSPWWWVCGGCGCLALVIAFILGLIFYTVTFRGQQEVSSEVEEAGDSPAETREAETVETDYYEVIIPSNWERDQQAEGGLRVLGPEVNGERLDLQIQVEELAPDVSLEAFSEQFLAQYEGIEWTEDTYEASLCDKPARRVAFTADGHDYLIYLSVYKAQGFILVMIAPEGTMDTEESTFDEVLDEFLVHE
jgi:hypothetical protein